MRPPNDLLAAAKRAVRLDEGLPDPEPKPQPRHYAAAVAIIVAGVAAVTGLLVAWLYSLNPMIRAYGTVGDLLLGLSWYFILAVALLLVYDLNNPPD